jgi:hypothetical protein
MGLAIIMYASVPALIISIIFSLIKAGKAEGGFFVKLAYFVLWFVTSFIVVLIVAFAILVGIISMNYTH